MKMKIKEDYVLPLVVFVENFKLACMVDIHFTVLRSMVVIHFTIHGGYSLHCPSMVVVIHWWLFTSLSFDRKRMKKR